MMKQIFTFEHDFKVGLNHIEIQTAINYYLTSDIHSRKVKVKEIRNHPHTLANLNNFMKGTPK